MACVNARATDSRRVAPACCMCAPDTLMGLKRGTSREQNSITSAVNCRAASTGKSQVPRAMYSFRGSFCSVPRSCASGTPCFAPTAIYMARIGAEVVLMVKLVLTLSRGMPSNRSSMSASESMATPTRPTSSPTLGSSESKPICVGKSKATLRPVMPWSSRAR